MKLQINTKGSWRDVLTFDASRVVEVEDAAASLSRAAGGLRLAVLDDEGERRFLNENGAFRPAHVAEISEDRVAAQISQRTRSRPVGAK